MNISEIIDRKRNRLSKHLNKIADQHAFYLHEWVKEGCPSATGQTWEDLRNELRKRTGDGWINGISLTIETCLGDKFAYRDGTFGPLNLIKKDF